MDNNVTFDEMNELLDEIIHSGGETWVEIDGQTYYTDWGYGVVAIEFFIRMLKNRKSDNDATQSRQDVAVDVDEILEHVINANMLSMPYDVYFELFDAVAGLGVEIENLQAENTKLRELLMLAYKAAAEPDCADCYNEHSCKNNDLSYCVMWVELEQKMRDELGMEAG